MPSVPKYQTIADDLKQAIRDRKIDPGQLLPSHQDLIQQYRVSLGTIRQALNHLVVEGWVRTERGRGVFANQLSEDRPVRHWEKQSTVGFGVFGNQFEKNDPVNMQFLHGAASVVQERGKELVYGIFPPEPAGDETFLRFLDRVSAVMVCQEVEPKLLEVLRARSVKTVIVGHMPRLDIPCDDFHQVYCDLESAGYLAAQVLALYGHRKVAFINKLAKETLVQPTAQGIRRACEQYRLNNEGIFYVTNPAQTQDTLDRLVSIRDLTGLIVFGDHGSITFIRHLENRGIQVPENRSVVGIGGLAPEQLVGWEGRLSRVNNNFYLMGQEAARLLLTDTPAAIHKITPVHFEKGATVGMAGNHE